MRLVQYGICLFVVVLGLWVAGIACLDFECLVWYDFGFADCFAFVGFSVLLVFLDLAGFGLDT